MTIEFWVSIFILAIVFIVRFCYVEERRKKKIDEAWRQDRALREREEAAENWPGPEARV